MRRGEEVQRGRDEEERPLLRALEVEPPPPDEAVYERGEKREERHDLEKIEGTTVL